MIGQSHQDIYVTACGQSFNSHRAGREHERSCAACGEEYTPSDTSRTMGWDCRSEKDELDMRRMVIEENKRLGNHD